MLPNILYVIPHNKEVSGQSNLDISLNNCLSSIRGACLFVSSSGRKAGRLKKLSRSSHVSSDQDDYGTL